MSTLPAKTQPGTLAVLSSLLDKHKDQIAVALPRHMTPERMIRVALTAVSRTPKLAECTPLSLAASIVQASILGLEPQSVLGEAYLVPFWNGKIKKNEAQLIPGYMGLLKLARNSGEVSMFDAQIVYEHDYFEFEKGSNTTWSHKWARRGARGGVDGSWAGYVLKDGNRNFEYWTLDQIEEHRDKYSKGAFEMEWDAQAREKVYVLDKDKNRVLTGAWADSPEWMWKKTVIRQTVKLMPKSVELATALRLDEMGEVGLPQDIDVLPVDMTDDPEAQGEPEATSNGPQRRSTSYPSAPPKTQAPPKPPVEPTAPADMDPKKIKPLEGTIEAIAGYGNTIGPKDWWAIMGDCGFTSLEEIPTQAQAMVIEGMMKARLPK